MNCVLPPTLSSEDSERESSQPEYIKDLVSGLHFYFAMESWKDGGLPECMCHCLHVWWRVCIWGRWLMNLGKPYVDRLLGRQGL